MVNQNKKLEQDSWGSNERTNNSRTTHEPLTNHCTSIKIIPESHIYTSIYQSQIGQFLDVCYGKKPERPGGLLLLIIIKTSEILLEPTSDGLLPVISN